ncbi:hypothetical protein BN1002_01144 [Bacillus sp. B-jedd]|nr:hypothetical protein BN1002_01144 [Bacillus sp. B-jedd]
MKRKTITSLLCLLLVAASLVGCSGKTESKSKDGEKVTKLRVMAYNAESTRATYLKLLDGNFRILISNLNLSRLIISTMY